MTPRKKNAVLPQTRDDGEISVTEVFERYDQALIEQGPPAPVPFSIQSLPPELQRAVQALCDTYETLDLRVETTLAAAENDFIAALSEVEGCEAELRQLISLFIGDLRLAARTAKLQAVVLRLSFRDENDLAKQILSAIHGSGEAP